MFTGKMKDDNCCHTAWCYNCEYKKLQYNLFHLNPSLDLNVISQGENRPTKELWAICGRCRRVVPHYRVEGVDWVDAVSPLLE